jgi:hypothetical protein
LPKVNESFKTNNPGQNALPSLSRTGNYFNPNPYNASRRNEPIGSVANGQRVASRRTSTRQKADIQANRIIHSRQRAEQFEHPQNVYAMNMN